MKKPSQRKMLIKLIAFMALSSLLISCETVGYYSQAARGQLQILSTRKPILTLLSDENVVEELKDKLRLAVSLKEFAAEELMLPTSDNFDSYVDLNRDHVIWNVFAAPEFSLNPVNWCYPIAGCVSYRGYFSEENALRFAASLEQEGFDVYTGGVDAYSTLGWFNDPLLSTVMNRADYQLAGLVFHELAHQVVYLKGDTTFNESFATTVEREGVKRWLQSINQVELQDRAQQDQARQADFLKLVLAYQEQFGGLYGGLLPDSEKREAKSELQYSMRADYERLKMDWGGYSGYDNWIYNSLNNAQLSTVSSYNSLVPFFDNELARLNGNLAEFYQRVKELALMDGAQRQELISRFDSY